MSIDASLISKARNELWAEANRKARAIKRTRNEIDSARGIILKRDVDVDDLGDALVSREEARETYQQLVNQYFLGSGKQGRDMPDRKGYIPIIKGDKKKFMYRSPSSPS